MVLYLGPQGGQRAVIQTLDSPFRAPHNGPNFGVGKPLHELEYQELLPLRRQVADEIEERFALLGGKDAVFRVLPLPRKGVGILERDFAAPLHIAVPVGDQVVGNAVQPGRKRHTAVAVVADVPHSAHKDPLGEVFGIVKIAGAVIHVIEDAGDVLLVQATKGLCVALYSLLNGVLFTPN